MMLKYIKLYEESTYPTIINHDWRKVTLLNPENKTVTIDIEVDDYGDRIDDYVREVGLSGSDEKYTYFFSGTQVDGDDSIEDLEIVDYDTIENINKKEEENKARRAIEAKEREERLRLEKQKDEEARIASGKSKKIWEIDKRFKEYYEAKNNENSPIKDKHSYYVIAKASSFRYNHEDRFNEEWTHSYLLKVYDDSLQLNYDELDSLISLGMLDSPEDRVREIMKKKYKDSYKLHSVLPITDPSLKKYIKYILLAREYADLDNLFDLIDSDEETTN